ncbi:M12 family metallo-peptidase [Streptomyces sp. NPDC051940]|uniref:InlB B-repeat-containing protein n=1 Tax=Streptomyces sp. NPDC051940 TaxID=3155675 RepID=UPI00343AB3BF
MRRFTLPAGIAATATLMAVVPLSAAAAAASQPPDPDKPWVLRSRTLEITDADYDWLCENRDPGTPRRHTFALFPPDVLVTAEQTQLSAEGPDGDTILWSGEGVERRDDRVTLAVSGACDSGPVSVDGHVTLPDRWYELSSPEPDTLRIDEVDPELLPKPVLDPFEGNTSPPPEDTYVPPDGEGETTDPAGGTEPGGPAEPGQPSAFTPPACDNLPTPPPPGLPPGRPVCVIPATAHASPATRAASRRLEPNSPAVIDVVVGYSPKALAEVGGQEGMQSRLALIESRMNQGLAATGVPASVDIVHSYAFAYTGDEIASAMLSKVQNPADPTLGRQAAQLRDKYAADLVALLIRVPDGYSSGQGSLPVSGASAQTSEYAWSATDIRTTTWWNNWNHELGHNFGLWHDRATLANQGIPPQYQPPLKTGWITTDKQYFTTMAYSTSCRPLTCSAVNQYADPAHSYLGRPLGDANNNQVPELLRALPYIADYRVRPADPTTYALQLLASPTAGGRLEPGTFGPYAEDTEVTVRAVPAAGYVFAGWSLDGVAQPVRDPRFTVRMAADHTLEARFTVSPTPRYKLTVGPVTPARSGALRLVPAGSTFAKGTRITMTATPAKGYVFRNWLVDRKAAGTGTSLSLVMNAAHHVQAVFAKPPVKVKLTTSVWPVKGGRVVPAKAGPYAKGTKIKVTARPATGYRIIGWKLDGKSLKTRNTSVTVTMDKAHKVSAVFGRR